MNQPAIKLPPAIMTLSDEHRYMNLLLDTLEEQLQKGDPTIAEDLYLMQDVVRYLHEYSDAVHHPTEDIMFGKLVNRDPAAKTDTDRLLRDHERLTENTTELLELLETATTEQTAATTEAIHASTTAYIGRMRQHMQFEESTVFPRTIQCLAGKDWHAIELRLESTEDPLFGANVDSEYRTLYEYFSDRADNMSQQLTKYGFLQLDSMIISADAFEMGLTEFWEMLHRHADSVSRESRQALESVFDSRSIASAIGRQLHFVAFLGKKVFDVGGDATGIYFRTLKQMAKPFLTRNPGSQDATDQSLS